jgi:hypothetical protein
VDQVSAGVDMFHPWQDEFSEPEISPGLPALQIALFHQFIAEPTESKSGLVVFTAILASSFITMIQIKRVYDPYLKEDGTRFLVERLWPRGMKKTRCEWMLGPRI